MFYPLVSKDPLGCLGPVTSAITLSEASPPAPLKVAARWQMASSAGFTPLSQVPITQLLMTAALTLGTVSGVWAHTDSDAPRPPLQAEAASSTGTPSGPSAATVPSRLDPDGADGSTPSATAGVGEGGAPPSAQDPSLKASAASGAPPVPPAPGAISLPYLPGLTQALPPSLHLGALPALPALREVSISTSALPSMLASSLGQRIVEGAPFCAEAITEAVRPLLDGNRIVQRSSAKLCRDAQGRTRQEVGDGAKRRVYIHDPVSKQSWMLDASQKTFQRVAQRTVDSDRHVSTFTTKIRVPAEVTKDAAKTHAAGKLIEAPSDSMSADLHLGERAREHAQRMSEWAKDWAERVRASVREGRDGRELRELRLESPQSAQVMVLTAPSLASNSVGTSGMQWISSSGLNWAGDAWIRSAARGTPVSQPLPAKDIEGVRAHGELSTWTIEVGKVGNEKPIRITREVWTSPELMLTVLSKDIDPREGEHHYRLTNVNRQAPDPELFKVPSDFSEKKR